MLRLGFPLRVKMEEIKVAAERFLSEGFFVTRAMRYLKN